MLKQRIFENVRKSSTGRRRLQSEQLERREMLAADLFCIGSIRGPVDSATDFQADSAFVESMNAGLQVGARNAAGGTGQSGNNGSPNMGQGTPDGTVGQGELSAVEQETLLYMWEEEKLAHDVYIAFEQTWNEPIFGNIAAAENQHMEAVGLLIDQYGLERPGENLPDGIFITPEFQSLYDTLSEQGSGSVVDAFKVGALIEELDIYDLQNALEDVNHDDITQTYENLMRGSRNHLRAFASQLATEGESYVVEGGYLTQTVFDEIANSPQETGSEQGQSGRPTEEIDNRNMGRGDSREERKGRSHSQEQSSRHGRNRWQVLQVSDNETTARHNRDRDRLFTQLGEHTELGMQYRFGMENGIGWL